MLKLISIHINKTAGRSFEEVLRQNYGDSVFKIHTHDGPKKIRRGRSCSELKKEIPDSAQVIHGHFKVKDILLFKKSTPIITWVRNPIDRVISNYFYVQKFKDKKESILGYIEKETSRNRMSKILSGISLDELFFIGIQENFKQDLEILGKKLNWNTFNIPYLNKTKYSDIDKKTRSTIKELNKEDCILYNKVLELR
jgi:hypothetical protein